MSTTKQTTKKVVKKKSEQKHIIVFDHARVDPSHCLTDGLFRPLKKDSIGRFKLDISYKYKGYTLRWLNYSPLSISDQSIFLAIHRLAAEKGRTERATSDGTDEVLMQVREAMKLELDAASSDCLVLQTTLSELATTVGITSSTRNLKNIRESITKLACVSFVIYKGTSLGDAFFKTNLFSRLAGIDGKISIGINPMLCRALDKGQSTFVSMKEQRLLKLDVSKRLHMWLSSWIRHGEERKIERDLLIPHIWGDTVQDGALRSRRSTLRKAFVELDLLDGWTCKENDDGNVIIKRPKL